MYVHINFYENRNKTRDETLQSPVIRYLNMIICLTYWSKGLEANLRYHYVYLKEKDSEGGLVFNLV